MTQNVIYLYSLRNSYLLLKGNEGRLIYENIFWGHI